MSFAIGQVIYVLSDKTQTVLPGIVQEEIHHRSIDGEKVSYRVAIGPQGKQRVVDLATVDGEVYGDLNEVRNVLIARLTAFVDDLCNTTNERVNQWYHNTQRTPTTPSGNGKLDPAALMNEVASTNGYPVQQQKPIMNGMVNGAVNGLNGLRSALADPDLNTREFIDSDGTIRKISINIPQ
jgi:hypothetical protein